MILTASNLSIAIKFYMLFDLICFFVKQINKRKFVLMEFKFKKMALQDVTERPNVTAL